MFRKADGSMVGDEVGRENEAYVRLALDAGQMAIWDFDVATGRLTGSPELYRLLGLDMERMPDIAEISARYFPGEGERLKAIGAAALARGERFVETDFRYTGFDGSIRWLMLRAEIFRNSDGTPRRYLGVLFDVTGRRAAELEQARGAAVKSAILEASLDCIITVDEDGRVVEWNGAAEETFGFTRAEALGRDLAEMIVPETLRARHRAGIKRYVSTGEARMVGQRVEIEALRADGSILPVELAINPVRVGERQYFTAFLRDITARKESEAQRKLLMRELAHRMKNTLTLVQSIARQTLRQAPDIAAAENALQGRLLALAQAQESLLSAAWSSAPIHAILERALRPYQAGDARFTIEGPELEVNARQALALSLALHELATNAVKYGALSNPAGSVSVVWSFGEPGGSFRLEWKESGGPPVEPPTKRGFGSRLIERALGSYFSGNAVVSYDTDGLRFVLEAPRSAFEAEG